jgi:hypothetical protein
LAELRRIPPNKTVTRGTLARKSFGPWFESAVGCRLLELLEKRPALAEPIEEIQFNVEVTKDQKSIGEYDVAILLKERHPAPSGMQVCSYERR